MFFDSFEGSLLLGTEVAAAAAFDNTLSDYIANIKAVKCYFDKKEILIVCLKSNLSEFLKNNLIIFVNENSEVDSPPFSDPR